ncbi:MAG TPA: MATE family efflux transporter [Candidatus Ozemobacteraceae bacterium]|nr:MATE family efflux transporter [Candidatus Ozemobacteraceae bacterium]
MKPLGRFRGPTVSELWRLAWPLALQSLSFSLLAMIDRVMVGQLSGDAIAAVGVGGQILFFAQTLAGCVASATAILAAQYRGARDPAGMTALSGSSLLLMGLIGVSGSALLMAVAGHSCLWLTGGNAAIAAPAAEFLRIIAPTFPFVLVMFAVTGIMRSLGDTRTPVVTSVAAVLVNTLLNALLINGYAGLPRFGTRGAAIATAVAHLVGTGLALRAYGKISFEGRRLGLADLRSARWQAVSGLLRLAAPIGLDGLFWQAAALAYTRIVGMVGGEAMAAYFMYQSVRGLGYIPLGSLGGAAAIIVGRHLGAGHPRRARMAVGRANALAILSALGMGAVSIAAAAPYLALFSVGPDVAAESMRLIRWFSLVLPFEAAIVIFSGTLRAGGDALRVSLITLATFWLVGIPLTWLAGVHLGMGLPGCFIGMSAESITKALLFGLRYRSGAWARRLTG